MTGEILLHIAEYLPHGRRFTDVSNDYPGGDPNYFTTEKVLKEMRSVGIYYFFFFEKIIKHKDYGTYWKMTKEFQSIVIGE